MKRRLAALLVLASALAVGGAGVATTAPQPAATASAYGVTIIVPGQAGAIAVATGTPGAETIAAADSFAYPADGSIVRTGVLSSSVSAQTAKQPRAQAVSDVLGGVLFNGEITFDLAAGRAKSVETADVEGSTVTNLVLFGQPVTAAPNQRFALGDWGSLVTLEGDVAQEETDASRDARAGITVIHVTLTAEHAGLPAGSEILIGRAEAATAAPIAEPPPATTVAPTIPAKPSAPPDRPKAKDGRSKPAPKRPRAPEVRTPPTDLSVKLSPRGYVFPIYGASSFISTWGALRASTGFHQGTDIFAPLGAPVLAVADGTLFSVGWNRVGGWRLWLRDRSGNEFYYAHLAAFAPVAVDGAGVRAGQVIAFNGNSGDAQGTPFHLHFEFHPVSLLAFGYKGGAVDPFPYLAAWRRVVDIVFPPSLGWAPPVAANATAPRPGAFLLGSADISSASGLEPGALARALAAPVAAEGDGALR